MYAELCPPEAGSAPDMGEIEATNLELGGAANGNYRPASRAMNAI
jgi:hypothetical protein